MAERSSVGAASNGMHAEGMGKRRVRGTSQGSDFCKRELLVNAHVELGLGVRRAKKAAGAGDSPTGGPKPPGGSCEKAICRSTADRGSPRAPKPRRRPGLVKSGEEAMKAAAAASKSGPSKARAERASELRARLTRVQLQLVRGQRLQRQLVALEARIQQRPLDSQGAVGGHVHVRVPPGPGSAERK